MGETTDIAASNADRVKMMSQKLFTMLDEMGARYPEKDPTWTAEREKKYMENIVNKRWPSLEKQRKQFLSKDFDPGNKWWGSMVVED